MTLSASPPRSAPTDIRSSLNLRWTAALVRCRLFKSTDGIELRSSPTPFSSAAFNGLCLALFLFLDWRLPLTTELQDHCATLECLLPDGEQDESANRNPPPFNVLVGKFGFSIRESDHPPDDDAQVRALTNWLRSQWESQSRKEPALDARSAV